MKPVSLVFTLLALALGRGPTLVAGGVEEYDVVWDSPSVDHHGSMPLGNGDVAVNAWMTREGDLQFYIGKTDAWDDNARLVKVGKVRVHFDPNPVAAGGRFRQELQLRNGCIEILTGAPGAASQARIRVWVDARHPVIQIEADSPTALTATATVELWRTHPQEVTELQISDVMMNPARPDKKQGPTITEPDVVLHNLPGRIGWMHHNIKSVGPKELAEVQSLGGFPEPDPLLHRTFGAVIAAPHAERLDDLTLRSPDAKRHRFSIFVLSEHPATAENWLTDMNAVIRAVEASGPDARWRKHLEWWAEFWERSWIRASSRPIAGPGAGTNDSAAYVSRMYHLQRFVTACAGRGAYPIKFNGSLFTVPPGPTEQDPDYRRWGPGYWWQNTRLPYISLCASGDFDLQRPLFRMYADQLLPLCRYRTRHYLGHGGAYYPECMMFWGPVFSETYGWTPFDQRRDKLQESGWHRWEWVGGLELCWMMLDYYDHTLDSAFLRKTALPFTREILTFFAEHYPTNAQGKLVMHPSQALETWWDCTNAAPEIAGCQAVTERLLALPSGLGSTEERALWTRLHRLVPALPLRQIGGRTALAPAESFANKSNIENPELYAVFPFRLYAFNRPHPEWATTALEHREDRGHNGWRQDDVFMAYLGLTDDVRQALVGCALSHDPNERFPAFWGPNYDWTPDQDHGGILMKTLQAMVLQTDGAKIYVLPAWPKEWDVDFRLHAPGATVVEGRYRAGKLERLETIPAHRRRDVVSLLP